MAAKVGDTIPDATFVEVPYTPELAGSISACGIPQTINTHKEFKGKKVVIIGVVSTATSSMGRGLSSVTDLSARLLCSAARSLHEHLLQHPYPRLYQAGE